MRLPEPPLPAGAPPLAHAGEALVLALPIELQGAAEVGRRVDVRGGGERLLPRPLQVIERLIVAVGVRVVAREGRVALRPRGAGEAAGLDRLRDREVQEGA